MAYPLSLSGVLPKSRVSRSAAWPGALFRSGRPEQSRQPRADTKTSEPQNEITTGSALQHTACKLGQSLPYRGRRNLMPGSYSTDLRERVLVAVEAGEPADVVAEAFMIGRSSVYRWIAAARDEGRRAAKPIGGGPKPIIRDEIEATLCRLLEENNHLTLVECRDRLAEATDVRVNPWTIGRALRRLDWT